MQTNILSRRCEFGANRPSLSSATSTTIYRTAFQPKPHVRRVECASQAGRELSWDPDNVLGPAQSGHIARREMQKRMQTDQKFAAAVLMAKDEDRQKVIARRESRTVPTSASALVEYYLNTLAEDMEFEVARTRPLLTPEFFKHLDGLVGQERFAMKPDQERLAELETLREYLTQSSEAVDNMVQSTLSATDKLKLLLTSKDKKATILDMVEKNQIDQGLVDLLQQNINAAREAGQEEPAKFMEKVLGAVAKYLVKTPAAA